MSICARAKNPQNFRIIVNVGGCSFVKLAIALIVLFFGLSSTGCMTTHKIHANPSLEKLPEVEKLPLKAGIYYSPEFKSYEHARIFGPHKYVVPIGQDSIKLFDKIFPQIFDETIHVDSLPPYAVTPAEVDIVLEPFIEHFHFRLGMEPLAEKHNVTYRFTLYTLDGAPVSTWRVMGKPGAKKQSTFVVYRHIDVDLEDAGIKFLAGFKEDSHILEIVDQLNRTKGLPTDSQRPDLHIVFDAQPAVEYIHLKDGKDVSLNEGGIVVIKVMLENRGETPINVNVANFRLILPGGKAIAPSGVSAIFPRFEERSYAGDVSAVALGGLIGALVTVSEEHAENKRRIPLEAGLNDKMLRDVRVVKGQVSEGLLYFIPSNDVEDFDRANLSLWISDDSFRNQNFVKSLQNLGYKKSMHDTKK